MHVEESSQVDKFLPMLQEYLTRASASSISLHTLTVLTVANTVNGVPREHTGGAVRAVDYVWDVFYRRACSYAEWTVVSANAGTVYVRPTECVEHPDGDTFVSTRASSTLVRRRAVEP